MRPRAAPSSDYALWTVPQLKAELDARGISHVGCIEKQDLIARLRAPAAVSDLPTPISSRLPPRSSGSANNANDGGCLICQQCTLRNPLSAARCEACGTPLDDLCPKCTLRFAPGSVSCVACGELLLLNQPPSVQAELQRSQQQQPAPHWQRRPPDEARNPTARNATARVSDSASTAQPSEHLVDRQARHEAEAAETHARVLELCSIAGEEFVDRDDFPPSNQSLYVNGSGWQDSARLNAHRSSSLGQLVWLRPRDISFPDARLDPIRLIQDPFQAFASGASSLLGISARGGGVRGGVTIVDDAPSADDIRQQALGDCWLISALALVAERPDLLRVLLPTREVNRAGAYQVRLCHDGEWRTMLIDDLLPCVQPRSPVGPVMGMPGVPAFAYAARRQLWVSLVEKAMAKLYGSYEALESGNTDEALATLTGYPCERLDLKAARQVKRSGSASSGGDMDGGDAPSGEMSDPELLWARLLSFHDAGFLLAASVGGSDEGEAAAADAMGLLTEHAYSLLRVVNARLEGGGIARLVQLRNPWGKLEWRGDWSARSPLWTPALRASLGYASAADDGTFWMSFDDLLDYFRFIEACRVRPHWAEVRVRGSLPVLGGGTGGDGGGSGRLPAGANGAGLGAFSIEVLDTCEVEVSLIQRNGRGDSTHEFTDLLVLAMQKDSGPSAVGGWRVVAASRRELRMSVTLEATLSAGHYMILPLSLRPRTGRHAAPLPYVLRIGSAKPLICEATAATATDVQAGLAGYIRSNGKRHAAFDGMCTYSLHDAAGWLTYAENTSSMMRFTLTLDHENSFNVLPSRGSLCTYDVLPPGRGQVLQVLSIASHEDGCRMQCRTQFRADMTSSETHSPDCGSIHRTITLKTNGAGLNVGMGEIGEMLSRLGVRFI